MRCQHDGCGWHAVAPSAAAARARYAEHVVREHAIEVDAEVPDGMVQVRAGEDDKWVTMTPECAIEFHNELHRDAD